MMPTNSLAPKTNFTEDLGNSPRKTFRHIKKGSGPMRMQSRQRESYPKFDLIAAKAAMDHLTAPVCVFEFGKRMIGQAFIVDVPEEGVVINSLIIDDDRSSEERQDYFSTSNAGTTIDRYRRLINCPLCGTKKWSLYFRRGWSCADCLRLIYRSQLVDKEVKLSEEREELRAQLKLGRPKGMHNQTYMKLRQRLFELENRLRDRPRKFASDSQNAIIHSRWVPGAEVDLWSTRYVVRGGQFVPIAPQTGVQGRDLDGLTEEGRD